MKSTDHKNLIFIIALFILPLPGMGVDAYAPSLPAVAAHFHSLHFLCQLSIPVYTVGYAISMLFSGTLTDILGIKRLSIGSLIGFAVLTLLIIFSPNIHTLIVLRFFQGAIVGFFAVSIRVCIIHLYTNDKELLKSKISTMQIAWSMGPILAPAIGGYLGHRFGWQSSFVLMMVYSLLMALLVTIFFKEINIEPKKINFATIKQSYKTILGSYEFLFGISSMGTLYAVAVSFNTVGSFLLQRELHLSTVSFGYCSLALGVAWLAGSLINKSISAYSVEKKIIYAAIGITVISLATILITYFIFNLWILMIIIISLNILAGIIYSGLYCMTLARFSNAPGNASGLMSSGILFTCALATTTVSKLVPHDKLLSFLHADMLLNLLSVFIVSILFYLHFKRKVNPLADEPKNQDK